MTMENFKQLRAEGALQRENERNERLKPIRERYGKGELLLDVYEIGEQYQIAKVEKTYGGKTETFYEAYVDFKSTREIAYSLELATLIAFAYKNDRPHSTAPIFAARVLNIKDEVGE